MTERRRLSTQDKFWLEMDRPNNLMVVDSVMWTSTPLDWDRLRDVMNTRFAGRYPVFRSLAIHDDDGSWWWQESPDFDLDDHVTMVTLDEPDDPASLQQLIAEHRTTMLDRSKPLWELLWVERYHQGSAVVMRTHHSIADGVRMVELAMSLFDSSADGGPILPPGITNHAAKQPSTPPLASRAVTASGGFGPTPARGLASWSDASQVWLGRWRSWPAPRCSTRSAPGTASSPRAPTRPTTPGTRSRPRCRQCCRAAVW